MIENPLTPDDKKLPEGIWIGVSVLGGLLLKFYHSWTKKKEKKEEISENLNLEERKFNFSQTERNIDFLLKQVEEHRKFLQAAYEERRAAEKDRDECKDENLQLKLMIAELKGTVSRLDVRVKELEERVREDR